MIKRTIKGAFPIDDYQIRLLNLLILSKESNERLLEEYNALLSDDLDRVCRANINCYKEEMLLNDLKELTKMYWN